MRRKLLCLDATAARRICPACGDRYLVGARCTFETPVRTCDAPGSPHIHWLCTRCPGEWIDAPDGRELAILACAN